jgi:hypothetical protein
LGTIIGITDKTNNLFLRRIPSGHPEFQAALPSGAFTLSSAKNINGRYLNIRQLRVYGFLSKPGIIAVDGNTEGHPVAEGDVS